MAPPEAAPAAVRHVTVGAGESGQRIDNFLLRELKGVPRSHVYRLLRRGEVRINGRRAKPEQRLEDGDEVRLPPVRVAVTLITGTLAVSCVCRGPSMTNPAPAACTRLALCINSEWAISL